jgi:hypothetical protein
MTGDCGDRARGLREYLEAPGWGGCFSPAEMSEPLLSVYNIVRAAMRAGGDLIRLNGEGAEFVHRATGAVARSVRTTDVRPMFDRVLERDPMMKAHVRRLKRDAAGDEYEIVDG